MSGNTKLIGFSIGGKVVLERWGGRTEVELPAPSIRTLTEAVHNDLPGAPPKKPLLPEGFQVQFDPHRQRVVIDMDLKTSARLHEGWEAEWVAELKQAVQAHRDFNDLDEPGLE